MEQRSHSLSPEHEAGSYLMEPHIARDRANDGAARRVLIIDKRAVMGTEIGRSLARRGYAVDVLGEIGSPAFYSRSCARRFVAPRWESGRTFLNLIHETVCATEYCAIFIC